MYKKRLHYIIPYKSDKSGENNNTQLFHYVFNYFVNNYLN